MPMPTRFKLRGPCAHKMTTRIKVHYPSKQNLLIAARDRSTILGLGGPQMLSLVLIDPSRNSTDITELLLRQAARKSRSLRGKDVADGIQTRASCLHTIGRNTGQDRVFNSSIGRLFSIDWNHAIGRQNESQSIALLAGNTPLGGCHLTRCLRRQC